MSGKRTNHDEEPQEPQGPGAQETPAEQVQETPAEETGEPATIPITTLPVRMKRCKDHPANFPDEDPLRPITEFYGKGKHSYCRRCDSIRSKRHREEVKDRDEEIPAELTAFRIGMLRRAVQIRIDTGTPIEVAVQEIVNEIAQAIGPLRTYLRRTAEPEVSEPEEDDTDA